MLSRRQLLAAASAGCMLPLLGNSTGTQKRRLLVLYAMGGWDPTWVFTDVLGHPSYFFDPSAQMAEGAGGMPFVDSPDRPAVRTFFERFGAKTSLINGMRVRGLTHPSALKLLMTDSNTPTAPDWASIIASHAGELELPLVFSSGPIFPGPYGAQITRLGDSGQLVKLLDGTALQGSSLPAEALDVSASDAVDAYLAERASQRPESTFVQDYARAMERVAQVSRMQDQIDLSIEYTEDLSVAERLRPALDCLETGLTRVVAAVHLGFRSGWDHHSGIEQQSGHYQILFTDLVDILDSMALRPGLAGCSLLDETTVLVRSEMGRAPILNAAGGKDHWVYTSTMLIGSGVQGGQVIGSYNADFKGEPMDLRTGLPDTQGTIFDSGHLGATLCELMSVPQPAQLNGKAPLEAVLS
ncbi:MAG: hypothetical protein ACI9VR_004275 [Cognaticolwellia sp.]|jgi:hypothetical protein